MRSENQISCKFKSERNLLETISNFIVTKYLLEPKNFTVKYLDKYNEYHETLVLIIFYSFFQNNKLFTKNNKLQLILERVWNANQKILIEYRPLIHQSEKHTHQFIFGKIMTEFAKKLAEIYQSKTAAKPN